MPITTYDDLSNEHLDFLREIGNIGSGNAASSLSRFLSKPIDLSVSKVSLLTHNEVSWHLGGPENVCAGLIFKVFGDINGMIVYVLRREFASEVVSHFFGTPIENLTEATEMDQSAIMELGNIMAGSYVNAISELTALHIDISVPHLCIDMVGAILSFPAVEFAELGDKVLFIEETILDIDKEPVQSHMFLVPDVASLNKLLNSMGLSN